MGGGLMQLVAYGAQDVYLTGDPQITFFKVVYRRHTNFSVESIQQTVNGTVGLGSSITCTISRNGDLINNLLIEATITAGAGASQSNLGFGLIREAELEIGGQRIDKQYSNWMNVWSELTHSSEKKKMLSEMVDHVGAGNSQVLYIPLQFWFCRDNGLALPLIALQYHEVKLKISFEENKNLSDTTLAGLSNFSAKIWADYVYLDTDERRKFAQTEHEYLIEQVQRSTESITGKAQSAKFRLNFNHPIKELVWVTPPSLIDRGSSSGSYSDEVFGQYATNVEDARLVLNGHERFERRSGTYFNYVQPYQHHTGCPSGGVYVYSFALNPEKHQPSGTCNFSRIDNATLELNLKEPTNVDDVNTMEIFAHGYNVLRIMSGMGGLAYSN
jgi:hypothetical protein